MSEAHRKYCVLLRRKNKLEEAREQCRKAIDLDSRNASAYNSLGNVLKDATSYTEAVAAYERALEIDSSFPAYSNLVTTLRLQGNYRKAINVARMGVAVFPDSAVAYYDLGMALLESGQKEEALDEFKQVIRLEPGMQQVVEDAMAKNNGEAGRAE
jgi:superkiller protein 3